MKIWKKIDKIISGFFILLIKIYQYILSPDKGIPSLRLKGRICMHEPHCSEYGIRVFKRYGLLKGLFLTSDRVLHCTGGMNKIYDPEFYKVVFFSSAPIGVPFLQELSKDKRFEIVGIVTQCDKPAGRGMEMCENIVKTSAKKEMLLKGRENISKIIFIHGSNFKQERSRYNRLYKNLDNIGIPIIMPTMPSSEKAILEEWLDKIDELKPDENTILIGHSRGGTAILRWLEKNCKTKIKKTILIATNDGGLKYGEIKECHKGRYTKKGYDFEKIKKFCNNFSIFQSKDDKFVNYKSAEENSLGLGGRLFMFDNKGHWGLNVSEETGFPELIEDIINYKSEKEVIVTPNKLNPEKSDEGKEFAKRLKNKDPDFLVVIAYGKIIPQAILDIPRIAPINIHGSLLPKYRGASPIQSIFLNNEKETGITIMKMDAGMDTGNMIEKLKFKIPFDWTCKEVIEKMKEVGPKFLNDVLWKFGKGLLGDEKQDNNEATYCNKIEKECGLIDPYKDSIESIYNKYRGFYLWPKTYFFFKKEGGNLPVGSQVGNDKGEIRIIIESLKLDEKIFEENKKNPLFNLSSLTKEVAGTKGRPEDLLNPAVIEIKVKPEGKKVMDWRAFVNGYLMKG